MLGILRAANKAPEDLKREVKLLAELRDKADLAAQEPALRQADKVASQALADIREEWKKVEAEWLAKVDAERTRSQEASSRLYRAHNAAYELARDLVGASLGDIRGPHIPDPRFAKPEQLAAEKAADDARAALRTRALTLAAVDELFFPPPPKPRDTVTRYEGCSWTYTPRA